MPRASHTPAATARTASAPSAPEPSPSVPVAAGLALGLDFGTTRTVVAAADRGNYPLVNFEDAHGDSHTFIPSIVAEVDGALVFGHEAATAADGGAPAVESFKRLLATPEAGFSSTVTVGSVSVSLPDLLTAFFTHVREQLLTASSVRDILARDGFGPIAVGSPAHARSAQRVLTLAALEAAGFATIRMFNEPSAAGFEYTHRHASSITSRRIRVLVYDLGGGTFDVSLIDAAGLHHDVLASSGSTSLGGADFDAVLADLALESAGLPRTSLDDASRAAVLRSARLAKEAIAPQTRQVAIELADGTAHVSVAEFYERATPLVERSLDILEPLVDLGEEADGGAQGADALAGILVVGGASSLPLVARALRARFGRRVRRSSQPSGSTAVGLAIAADPTSEYRLTDRLSRGFGVFREAHGGAASFHPIFDPDVTLGFDAPRFEHTYEAVHTVGHLRFMEYSSLDANGQPIGDLTPLTTVLVPYDPALQDGRDLAEVPVTALRRPRRFRETYSVSDAGVIVLEVTDLATGHTTVSRMTRGEQGD
ncbi:MAG: Hsp70 family protein [Dermabacter sp.]|nr:Hsp70 family protein [Dermabacter sp.]